MLFVTIYHILLKKENIWFDLRRQKRLSTENNVRPNRDDGDQFLFITIVIDLVSQKNSATNSLIENF
jgi:hypothetical protein